jgi:hypothetical protein
LTLLQKYYRHGIRPRQVNQDIELTSLQPRRIPRRSRRHRILHPFYVPPNSRRARLARGGFAIEYEPRPLTPSDDGNDFNQDSGETTPILSGSQRRRLSDPNVVQEFVPAVPAATARQRSIYARYSPGYVPQHERMMMVRERERARAEAAAAAAAAAALVETAAVIEEDERDEDERETGNDFVTDRDDDDNKDLGGLEYTSVRDFVYEMSGALQ